MQQKQWRLFLIINMVQAKEILQAPSCNKLNVIVLQVEQHKALRAALRSALEDTAAGLWSVLLPIRASAPEDDDYARYMMGWRDEEQPPHLRLFQPGAPEGWRYPRFGHAVQEAFSKEIEWLNHTMTTLCTDSVESSNSLETLMCDQVRKELVY